MPRLSSREYIGESAEGIARLTDPSAASSDRAVAVQGAGPPVSRGGPDSCARAQRGRNRAVHRTSIVTPANTP